MKAYRLGRDRGEFDHDWLSGLTTAQPYRPFSMPKIFKYKKEITQEYLKSIFDYCHESGNLIYRVKVSKKINLNQVAGTIQKSSAGKPYLHIIIDGYRYRAHHLVWLYVYGQFPSMIIDHIDGNGLNNKLSNLEEKSESENHKNKRLFKTNKTGISGVHFRKDKFTARIKLNYICHNLLTTADFFEACCARKAAENRFGFHENHGTVRPL